MREAHAELVALALSCAGTFLSAPQPCWLTDQPMLASARSPGQT